MATVAVAGASGALGRRVAEAALGRGDRVIALVRDRRRLPSELGAKVHEVRQIDPRPGHLAPEALAGVEVVFSAIGASVEMKLGRGWRGYLAIDTPVNRALIDAAKAGGARRFVYVSTHHAPNLLDLAYVKAHERVVEHLKASGLEYAVLRPTGFFSALGAFVDLARRGAVPEMGDGSATSNPIHDDDLAAVAADALHGGPAERAVGGPEVLTRRQMAELAFASLGRPPKIRAVPLGAARFMASLMKPFHPRIADFTAFLAAISGQHLVAERVGTRTLGEYYKSLA